MMDSRRLGLLPDNALLVNVGRGTVVDQRALEKELRAGRLYAALDVFEQEPLPPEDSLWDCPNLLMAPHVAGNMTLPYTRDRIVELFLEDFENYCAGRPLARRVNLGKGY
jgi:phosphoglycerate dehydrogenase-like enzyme